MVKRLFVDMDGTLARFHDEAQYLERMWEPDFFRNLQPFGSMVNGVRNFIEQHPDVEVYILSSKILGEPPYCEMEKNAWLDKYLPEIDAAHRIFPATGTSKADAVPGGITAQDYLLDDYNKALREWEAAGGCAIKCHNNINQRGVGAYGGERGNLWGAMAHITDRPELIAAELAQHMGEAFDLQPVAEAYGLKVEYGRSMDPSHGAQSQNNAVFEVKRGDGRKLWYTYAPIGAYRDKCEVSFENPLNAIRSTVNPMFIELPIMPDGELCHLTRAEVLTRAENLKLYAGRGTGDARFLSAIEWNQLRDTVEARLKPNTVVGRVRFANGEKIEYTNAQEYVQCVAEELPYRATSGFEFETLTDDPQTRKAVDDLYYDHFGEENPRPLEDYERNKPVRNNPNRTSVKTKIAGLKGATAGAPNHHPKNYDHGVR